MQSMFYTLLYKRTAVVKVTAKENENIDKYWYIFFFNPLWLLKVNFTQVSERHFNLLRAKNLHKWF